MSEAVPVVAPLASVQERAHQASDLAQALVEEVKPRLRGWLHAAIVPVTLAAGLVLVLTSAPGAARVGSAVFATSALVLFSVSATLHRGRWGLRTNRLLTRLDHACIFLLIAGTYTPFTLLLLDGTRQVLMLSIAWGGALLGATFRVVWTGAPRWLYTPLYIALGWASVFFLGDFLARGGVTVVALIAAGGLLYTVGGVVYGLRRPNPIPSWFEFHEVFHAFTVVAFAAHYTGVTVLTHTLR
ncbi:PAQR family membrane homeostasis protein TrhA [Nocardioides marmoribigeumensis]|uniref:Hemolysin III n=1 Tax=Nocardioides marmoribigeumensis TaxID=433649 RepID=A0ABU2BRV2_9ACTN|nr:hemolysin III family protein [Nocardioides marmoribigeumensis]MDR7361372.1 hemolysin III [Nocardioides marmoribigeumensis]